MLLGEMHHESVPLPRDAEHMHPYASVEAPPRRGMLHRWAFVVGTRRVLRLQGGAHAGLPRGIHQHTPRHDHEQRHEALGRWQRQRGGDTLRVLHTSAPACCMPLAFVPFHHRWRRQWGGVKRMGGQEATTLGGNEGVAGREGRGQGPVALGEPLVGRRPWSGASPCARAGQRAHRARVRQGGLYVPLAGPQRLTRIGCARTGGTAYVPQGFDVLVTLLAPLRGDGALRW